MRSIKSHDLLGRSPRVDASAFYSADPLYSRLQLCYMLFVDQHVTVSSFTGIHIHDSLVGVLHGTLLDHRMDIVLSCKFQHLSNISWRADRASSQLASFSNECKSTESWKLVFRCSDLKGHVSFGNSKSKDATHLDELSVCS
jgi:hypothetical protein